MIGRSVSHYRIIEQLGAGGMGVVYKAEDTRLGRLVALKFLPAELTRDSEAKSRFIQEARAASALQHHNICTIHEIDETPEGRLFISMDCYRGETLKEKIARGPLPVGEAAEIARQIAAGLSKAHEAGMVHRDVKPANIMVTDDGVVKILDFGLAKLAGMTKLTRTGTTVGTVAYMSPEQARGEEVDARSDIWSLGAIAYEMLAGRTAFTGDYEQAVIYKILHEEPEAISLLRPDVSTSAARVIGRALRKDPRERYSSMGELLADLEAGGPGSAPSGWGKKRPQAGFLARHRRAAAALLVLAAATAGGLVLMKWTHPAGSVDPALAVMDFEDLGGSGDTLAAAGLNGLLQVGLIERSPVRVVSPEYLQDVQRRLFSGAIGAVRPERAIEVARRAGASLLLSGQLGGRKGATYVVWRLIETGRGRSVGGSRIEYSELVGLADGIIAEVVPLIAAQARVEATAAAGSVERITSSSPEAFRRFTAAEAAIARDAKDDALQELEAAVRIDSTFALAYLRITDIYWERTEFVPARKYANKAWSLRARLGIKDRMLLESRRLQLDRHIAAAMDVYGEMMARWPDDRSILQSYVYALYWWWYFSEAQGVAEMAIERYPDDETFHSIREAALRVQGKGAEALASARAYRRRHPEDPASWSRIGESHLVAGSIDSAEASFRRALGMKPDDLSMEHDLARIPFLRGDTEMAREMLERLITRTNSYGWIFQFHFGNGIQFVVPGLVHCYCETGRLSRALELADAFNLSFEQDAERLVQATHMEATLLLDWGRPRAVLDLARDLSAMDEVDYAQAFALRLRTEALVDLDSLDAAREGLEEILGRKDWFGVFVRYVPHLLAARLALAEGRPESALAHLDSLDVACTQKWETRARAYRAMNRLPEAAAVLEDLLRINSGRFIARYALGQIYEEMGRRADAARQYEIFLKAWENADPGWPQVEDARRRLAALRVASGA